MSALPVDTDETIAEALSDSKLRERFFGTGEQPENKLGLATGNTSKHRNSARSGLDDPVPADKYTSCRLDEPVKLQTSDKGALSQKPSTVMTAFQMTVDRHHDTDAFAVKVDGKWQKTKLLDMHHMVQTAAKGFLRLGLERFHGVGIVGFNAPEWIISYLAAIFAGGVAVGIHYTCSAEACRLLAFNTECNIIVVNSAEDLAKVLQIRPKLPELQAIVQYGQEGLEKTRGVYSWSELLEMGEKTSEDRLKDRIQSQAPNYCCTVTSTVGRTGPSKMVMLSHDNVIWTTKVFGKYQSFSNSGGAHVSYLPLSLPTGQVMDIFIPLLYATTIYFVPRHMIKEKRLEIMRDVRPTFFVTVPHIYEKFADGIQRNFEQNAIKRVMLKKAMDIGYKAYLNAKEGKPRPFGWWLANHFVFKKVRRIIGFNRCIEVHSAGRQLLPTTSHFFISLNILILDNYGSCELSGPHAVSLPERHRVGSCGVEMDGCRTKYVPVEKTPYTEMYIKGRHVFMGYLNEPQKTENAFDEEGWYKTGDFGNRDDSGFLYITGCIDEVLRMDDGRVISPVPIEMAVRARLPFIGHCIACGTGRPYIIMLFTIDAQTDDAYVPQDVVSKKAEFWLRKINVHISPISQMVSSPPKNLVSAIQGVIDQVNEDVLDRSTAIQKWKLLPKDFSPATGELVTTYRLKRFVIHEMYATLIDAVYDEG